MTFKKSFVVIMLALVSLSAAAEPNNFRQAKKLMRSHVYHDQENVGTTYCGCNWKWKGESGGRVDLSSCGYDLGMSAKRTKRAERSEWEHIVPAEHFGRQLSCWRSGGRSNCKENDPVFRKMEANMFNLTIAIGQVNADRSNYRYAELGESKGQYGQCQSITDFKARKFEPRDEAKGMVARTTFYMADRYGLRLSKSDQQLFMAWDKMFPVSAWEKTRDQRISRFMGHHNPFVTGQKKWHLGFKPSGVGIPTARVVSPAKMTHDRSEGTGIIHGNRRSMVYHLPIGCPSYNAMSSKNRVEFRSEQEALSAGFRKAGNCK